MSTPIATFVGKVIGTKLSPKSHNWSNVYVYEPTIDKVGQSRGNLYLILDLPKDYEELGNTIINSMREKYYADLDVEPLTSLEATLAFANKKIDDFNKRLITLRQQTLKRINITAAILVGQDLHIAQIGDGSIYLIRKGRLNKIGNVGPQQKTDLPAFVNIASGKIEVGDIMTFNTNKLFEIVPLSQFKEIVTTCYPSVAASRLSELITKHPALDNVPSVLVVEINANIEASTATPDGRSNELPNRVKVSKDTFAAKLNQTEDDTDPRPTEQAQTPNTPVSSTGFDNTSDAAFPSFEPTVPPLESTPTPVATEIPKPIASPFQNSSGDVGGYHPRRHRRNDGQNQLLGTLKNFLTNIPSWSDIREDPSKISKIFLLIGIVLILVVGFSVIRDRSKSNPAVKSSQALTEAQTNYNLAMDKMRTNDLVNAREYLLAALDKAHEAQTLKIYSAATINSLIADIQSELDTVDHVTRITDATPIADLSTLASDVKPVKMAFAAGSLFFLDNANQRLYAMNKDTHKLTVAKSQLTDAGSATLLTVTKDIGYLFGKNETGANQYFTYDPKTNKVTKLAASFNDAPHAASVLTSWTDNNAGIRLYAVDPTVGGVWRYRFAGAKLTAPTDIINADTTRPDFKNVIGAAVDGNVYLLMNSGELLKYVNGKIDTNFKLKGMAKPLTDAVALATFSKDETSPDATGKYIYIADHGNKQILIFNKADGALNKIYAATNAFNDLKDIYIDELSNLLFILDGTKVYQIQL